MNDLQSVLDLLQGPGEPMTGCALTADEAHIYMREHFPRQAYCLVRDWIWLDLIMEDKYCIALATTDRLPVMLYADTVVYDSAVRWGAGDFVRTSPLHRFDEGCLFHTHRTIYVLMGPGSRKPVAPETVMRIV